MYLNLLMISEYKNKGIYTENSDWSNFSKTLGQFFYLLFIFIIILVLAYFVTKWFSSGKFAKKGYSNIKIIENIFVNQYSNILLIKIGERYMLLGITKEKISFLSDINKEELTFSEKEKLPQKIPFEKYLHYFQNKK